MIYIWMPGRDLAILVLSLVALLLSACAVTPPAALSQQEIAAAWQQHRAHLAQLDSWSFSGRLAVRDKMGESWTVSLNWQQTGEGFDIRFDDSFGRGVARLFGHRDYAVIETPEQSALSAVSAEALMEEQLGWSVPMSGVRYWLIGLPEPAVSESREFDEAGRLRALQQSGWQIRYRSYGVFDGLDLPRKLELENPRLRARLVIEDWQYLQRSGV